MESSSTSSQPAAAADIISGSKRKHPESPTYRRKEDDLTRDQIDLFFDTEKLTDRERLSWALQTEQRVRLTKLETRNDLQQISPTLSSSEHLFDVYPEVVKAPPLKQQQLLLLERDRYAFQRKCHPTLAIARVPDDSLKSIVSLDLSSSSSHEKHPHALSYLSSSSSSSSSDEKKHPPAVLSRQDNVFRKAPVPPNLLYFEILLEAYMGYKLEGCGCYHSMDPHLPRSAVMGGAVVAALTGWRDDHILELFQGADLERELNKNHHHHQQQQQQQEDSNSSAYVTAKKTLVTELHDWFLYHEDDDNDDNDNNDDDDDEVEGHSREPRRRHVNQSPFSTGDVDIFLQASPRTRSIVLHLIGHGMNQDVRKHILSFSDACGAGQEDLHRMGKKIYDQLVSKRRPTPIVEIEDEEDPYVFVYALSKNALNSLLTVGENFGEHDDVEEGLLWPRCTQLIMLSEMADLVGGLMDFDISLVACAYDGNGVHVTPRSAYSLVTMTQIVTPFIMEEHRNWQRIIKYYKRGFEAYVLDPNCRHSFQCTGGQFSFNDADPLVDNRNAINLSRGRLRNYENFKYPELERFQDLNGTVDCCHCDNPSAFMYSFVVFEREEGEAIEFFAKVNDWSDEIRAAVEAVHPQSRRACRNCRYKYEDYSFVKANLVGTEDDDEEDLLRGGRSFAKRGVTEKDIFSRRFYSGGVFDAKKINYSTNKALAALDSQLTAEKTRYWVKHETLEGYKPRFTHGTDIDELFRTASTMHFEESKRPPVGLNPERFIASCHGCKQWLLDCEFGVQYCEKCDESKPAAKKAT